MIYLYYKKYLCHFSISPSLLRRKCAFYDAENFAVIYAKQNKVHNLYWFLFTPHLELNAWKFIVSTRANFAVLLTMYQRRLSKFLKNNLVAFFASLCFSLLQEIKFAELWRRLILTLRKHCKFWKPMNYISSLCWRHYTINHN